MRFDFSGTSPLWMTGSRCSVQLMDWKDRPESIWKRSLKRHPKASIGNTTRYGMWLARPLEIQRYVSHRAKLTTLPNHNPTQDIKHNQILNELGCIYGAAFNSSDRRSQCLKGTQVPILRLIENWCCKPSEPPVFWLQGMAGTGKSTIACTVATALQGRRLLTEDEYLPGLICLGGSFFFDKNISDQKTTDKVIPTLARNLANALPDFKGLLSDQI